MRRLLAMAEERTGSVDNGDLDDEMRKIARGEASELAGKIAAELPAAYTKWTAFRDRSARCAWIGDNRGGPSERSVRIVASKAAAEARAAAVSTRRERLLEGEVERAEVRGSLASERSDRFWMRGVLNARRPRGQRIADDRLEVPSVLYLERRGPPLTEAEWQAALRRLHPDTT
ncbi:MAG TPA: hypothetical protein VN842_00020 [Thermoplasmata archaeon]|nr:hypothetical protein [Thermoplasmata archaeon]